MSPALADLARRPAAPPFRKVLVANRGEIAIRICRTLREMAIPSVAVYSDADRSAPHARAAGEAVRIGPPAPAESYLDVAAILGAARTTGADAIHPGYGFLSQSAAFSRACAEAGVVFIGPSAESMERLGDKESSRRAAVRLGVPVVPGVEDVPDAARAAAEAARIGYPVLLKAAGGGGGRGMRRVENAEELPAAFQSARREAVAAFGNGRLFVEKVIHPARHVEIQVLGDGRDAIAIGERECSLQRRYQKVIEESPSTAVTPAVRGAMERAAVQLARDAAYAGAATVEFLLGPDDSFYFLEVNTRLQVEHPVTEMRFGLDLVRAQIEIAAGNPLPRLGAPRGHAIEARLNAEDPYRGFLPQTGTLYVLRWPEGEGVRVDAGVAEGQAIHAHYDSLLAKVIAHGPTRDEARPAPRSAPLARAPRGRHEPRVPRRSAYGSGVRPGGDVHALDRVARVARPGRGSRRGPPRRRRRLLRPADGARRRARRRGPLLPVAEARAVGAVGYAGAGADPRARGRVAARRGGGAVSRPVPLRLAGKSVEAAITLRGSSVTLEREGRRLDAAVRRDGAAIEVESAGRVSRCVATRGPRNVWVALDGRTYVLEIEHRDEGVARGGDATDEIRAPMTGRVVAVAAAAGAAAREGDLLLTIEAMKMEFKLTAPENGTVLEVACAEGDRVELGQLLVRLRPDEAEGGGGDPDGRAPAPVAGPR